jgi:hypothetical protein
MSATTYGLVAVGFSSSSVNTLFGFNGFANEFGFFVNLYYYYDPELYTDETYNTALNGPRPKSSGWMMPRNVMNASAFVSGNATSNAGSASI